MVEWFDGMNTSLGTTNMLSGLAAGAYSVVITDANSCSETFNTSVNDIGAEIIMTTFSDVSCFGGNDGSATVSFTCTDPGCTVEWFNSTTGVSTGQTTNTATNLSANDYYVEVINNSGCKAVENVTISQPVEFQVFENITNNSCGNGNAGAISLNGFRRNRNVQLHLVSITCSWTRKQT